MPRRLYSDAAGRESHIPTAANRLTLRSSTCTPMQTPMGARTRPSNLMMTSEKKSAPPTEDKKWLQGCITRVTDQVKTIRDLGNDFVAKGGLKSMSSKDFVVIINHIGKQINPKANFNSNYSDELHKFLMQIEYPYSVNKSWFKTPNAPHSFNHIVIMLDYLLDYLPWDENDGFVHDYDTVERTIKGSNFPSIEFTHHFRQKVMEGYQLWNNEKNVEFGKLQQELKDDLTKATTNGEFKNQHELERDIERLEMEIAEIVPVDRMDEREISKLEKAVVARNVELKGLIDYRTEIVAKNAKLLKELQGLEGELRALGADEERLKKIVSRQGKERIRENFEEMSQEFAKLNAALQGKLTFIDRLSKAHYNKMLLYTKLVHQQSDLLSTLMVKLMELKGIEEVAKALQLGDLSCLESTAELERLKQDLGSFSSTVLNNREQEVEGIEKQIGELNNFKIAYRQGVLQKLLEKVDALNAEYARLQSELVDATLGKEMYFGQLQDQVQQLKMFIADLQKGESTSRMELVRLDAEKQRILSETKKKIAYVMGEREKNYDDFKVTLREFDEALRKLQNA